MSTPSLLNLDISAAPEEYVLPPEQLIRGNPKQTVWRHDKDPSGQFLVGV